MKEIDDPIKSNSSEGNNSSNWRDEPLVDPLDEEEIFNPFEEERSITSRFLSRVKRTGRRIKRAFSKLRYTQAQGLSGEPDSSEYADEDIIFPREKKSASSGKRKKRSFLTRAFGWIFLLVFVFSLGHFTRPELIENTYSKIKEWTLVAIKKTEPLKEKMEEKVTKLVDKKTAGAEKSGRKIKFWQAPMNPSFTSDKPGKGPMGMDLVPVYEEEGPASDGFRISPTMVQDIGVKTEIVKTRVLSREIRTVGIVTYDERVVTHIHTKYKGWVEKLHVDFTGQEVAKDELLAEIYSPELVSTQEELLVAMKYKESLEKSPFTEIGQGADRLFESTKRRLELFDVPEHQIETLIRDKKITKTLHIHSPYRGFVIKKEATEGMFVQPGMSLYTIADLSNIWVMADVYEYELPWIKIGQKAEMSLSYYPGKKFHGKVTYIDPFMDPKTRTLKVRMEFKNPKWDLKPDMYANVILKSTISKRAVAVPEEAVIHSGENNIVIVRLPDGGFDSRQLTLGPQTEGYYQVLKGLKAGETIVTSSSFLLDSESNLREALNKLQEVKKKTPSGKVMDMSKMKPKKIDASKMKPKKMDMSKMNSQGKTEKIPGVVEVRPENINPPQSGPR